MIFLSILLALLGVLPGVAGSWLIVLERAGVLAWPVVGRWPGYADDHQGADGRQYLVVVAGGMVPQGRKPEIRSSPMPCPDE